MLSIKNLYARVEDKEILRGLTLDVKPGEVHAIMGPNGSGKSTLTHVLSGRDGYDVTSGEITYFNKNLLDLEPEERACEGIFLAFQYPVEIPGVSNIQFLRTAMNSIRKYRNEEELDAAAFLKLARQKIGMVNLDPAFLKRGVNEGFLVARKSAMKSCKC